MKIGISLKNIWHKLTTPIFNKPFESDKLNNGLEKEVQANYGLYGGYSYGRTPYEDYRSGGAKWPGGLSRGGHYGRVINHCLMRKNARNAYYDTPQAKSLVDRYADTVADTGLRLEAMPVSAILGITKEHAERWASDVESRFHLFMRDKKQNRSELITIYQSQRLYQIFQHRDNDIFVRFYYSSDRRLQNPLQFEFIDPDQIRGDAFTSTFGVQSYLDGIERDSRGREKEYKVWIRDKSRQGHYINVDIKARGPKSGRVFMLHGFSPEYAGQGRGYSRLGFALQELENITDFSMAQIKKAINQSSIVAMMENKDLNPSNPLEGILTDTGAGPAAERFGDTPTPDPVDGNVTDASLLRANCYRVPEGTIDTPGSMMIMNAQRGDKLTPFAQNAPSESYNQFVDAFFSYLSAGMGMPLEVVLMKFGKNFSASRGALLLFWRVVLIWRDEMASDYLNPLYEMWLSEEIAAARVSALGWSDPILRQAWLNNSWIGSPAPDIDPSKTAKARRDNIEIGVTNLDRESRAFNGSDAKTNLEKNRVLFTDTPVPPWSKTGGGDNPGGENTGSKDDDE